MHHGHRGRVRAIATTNRRWSVAIELGTCRCGLIGGAAGSVTFGNSRSFEHPGATRSEGGNGCPFGDQESVGCDAQRAVVMEAWPATALVVAEPDFLLEVPGNRARCASAFWPSRPGDGIQCSYQLSRASTSSALSRPAAIRSARSVPVVHAGPGSGRHAPAHGQSASATARRCLPAK